MDNATAVNNAGGSKSHRLCQISAELVAWCAQCSISINAEGHSAVREAYSE